MTDHADMPPDTNAADEQPPLAEDRTPRRRFRLHPLLAVLVLAIGLNAVDPLIIAGNPVLFVVLLSIVIIAVLIIGSGGIRSIDGGPAGGKRFTRPVSDSDKAVRIVRDTPPRAFRQRLAGFLGRPESEVLVPRPRPVSAMPFWSIVPLPQNATWSKSVAFMRQLLERIRAAVRGGHPPAESR